MLYLYKNILNGFSSNSKARPSFPLKSQVLLMCSVNLPFDLDLATHHALNLLHTFSPLEFGSFFSSQSVGLLPKLSPTHSDFFLLWDLGRAITMCFTLL